VEAIRGRREISLGALQGAGGKSWRSESWVASADVDGAELNERPLRVPLVDDGSIHHVKWRLG